ncbi:hypothetical protein BDD12DRAFT_892010 [Trichophaea hybrida]|nr:hypothetical protein BDD12DRAFT_892010 [Trichophaea hybrida]
MQLLVSQQLPVPQNMIPTQWFITPPENSFEDLAENPTTKHNQHYVFAAGEVLLNTDIADTENFRAALPVHRAEVLTLKFQELAQELHSDFTSDKDPLAASSTIPVSFVPLSNLTKRAEELRKRAHGQAMAHLPTIAERVEIEAQKRKRGLSINTRYLENTPMSSVPAILNSGSLLRAETPGCRLEMRYRTGKLVQQETQDLNEMEVVWFQNIGAAAVYTGRRKEWCEVVEKKDKTEDGQKEDGKKEDGEKEDEEKEVGEKEQEFELESQLSLA